MSRNLETSIYSLDGKSVFDIALKFERLGIQEMSKNSEVLFQGVEMTDSNIREAIKFKANYDKLFSLFKEFYIKVLKGNNVLSDIINEDVLNEFDKRFKAALLKAEVKTATSTFLAQFVKPVLGPTIDGPALQIQEYILIIYQKIGSITNRGVDCSLIQLAKLEMIEKALTKVATVTEDSFYPENFGELREIVMDELRKTQTISKRSILSEIRDEPLNRTKIDTNTSIRLATFEGTASNVLRDILITSSNMVEDIKMKTVVLQEALRKEPKFVESIAQDSVRMMIYIQELQQSSEVKKNYSETFEKVADNIDRITDFVDELDD